jgi:very-short-patch-repair endonuclease
VGQSGRLSVWACPHHHPAPWRASDGPPPPFLRNRGGLEKAGLECSKCFWFVLFMLTRTKTLKRARQLRRKLTPPEFQLWMRLKQRDVAPAFRRQQPFGPYILDFYCSAAKLAVEVDGWSHGTGDNPDHDLHRDAWLRSQGVRVMRYPASDLLRDPDGVVAGIRATAAEMIRERKMLDSHDLPRRETMGEGDRADPGLDPGEAGWWGKAATTACGLAPTTILRPCGLRMVPLPHSCGTGEVMETRSLT